MNPPRVATPSEHSAKKTHVKAASASTLEQLAEIIHQELCCQQRLDASQNPLETRTLLQGSSPCGLWFAVAGPRLQRGYAVWVSSECRVLLYDSSGARAGEVALTEAPDLLVEPQRILRLPR